MIFFDLFIIFLFLVSHGDWKAEKELKGHTDWVRSVAWAPSTGLNR